MFAGFRLPRRRKFILRLILCLAALVGEAFLWRWLAFTNGLRSYSPVGLLDFLIQYLMVVMLMWICFDVNFWAALFCGTVGYCLEHTSERLFESVKYFGIGRLGMFPQYLIRTGVLAAVCVLVYFLLMRRSKYYNCAVMVDNKLQTITAVCIVAVVIYGNSLALSAVRQVGNAAAVEDAAFYIHMISAVFAFVGLVLEFSISSGKTKEEELSVVKRMLKEERERYDSQKENIELINIKCHDMRHQIAAFGNKLDKAEIASITDAIGIYDADIHTGNDALDVVLTEKSLVCRKNGIKLTCLVDGAKLDFIPAHEIYSLFGNALENAINAVKDLEPEKRVVSITNAGRGRLVNICVENYYAGKLSFASGLPVTRGDTDFHGFGMKSMRYIAEKYNGALRASVCGEIFVLEILLAAPPALSA